MNHNLPDPFDRRSTGRPQPRPWDDESEILSLPVPTPASTEPDSPYFIHEEDESFEFPEIEKLGIIGPKAAGKTYLLQAMVYRTFSGVQSGALSSYLQGIRLFTARTRYERPRTVNLAKFLQWYARWDRLPQTTMANQQWFRLRLTYRTGLLGRARSALDVDVYDGSGEGFFQAEIRGDVKKIWQNYLDARVMIFCLPLWVALPAAGLSPNDRRIREDYLAGFEQVVQNYLDIRMLHKRTQNVKTILALTMADDRRCALTALYDRWICPYMDNPKIYLKQLRRSSNVARYLANACRISEVLHEEFNASRDPRVSSIPRALDFGGKPWLIPVSAISGEELDRIEEKFPDPEERLTLFPPVPVHVELPLFIALCERTNALM